MCSSAHTAWHLADAWWIFGEEIPITPTLGLRCYKWQRGSQ